MNNENSRWGVLYHTAWTSWWYHHRKASSYRFWTNFCLVTGALALLFGGFAYSMGWSAVGALSNILGFFGVVGVQYLRIDVKEHAHLDLAGAFGDIWDQAQFAADDADQVERLWGELAKVQDHCILLFPKEGTPHEALYIAAAIIRLERWRFNYGRAITASRLTGFPLPLSPEIIAFVRGELLQAAPVEQHVLGEETTTSRVDRWKAWVAEHSATPSEDADATIMDDALAAIRKRQHRHPSRLQKALARPRDRSQ